MLITKYKLRKSRKSQAAVADLILSFFIITALVLLLFFVLTRYYSLVNQKTDFTELEIVSIQILDSLVESPGVPANWEEDYANVEIIGLASYNRNLSKPKIGAFLDLDYTTFKKSFSVLRYDFYFAIKLNDGSIVVDDFPDGGGTSLKNFEKSVEECRPSQKTRNIVVVTRRALYKGDVVTVELKLWPRGESIC